MQSSLGRRAARNAATPHPAGAGIDEMQRHRSLLVQTLLKGDFEQFGGTSNCVLLRLHINRYLALVANSACESPVRQSYFSLIGVRQPTSEVRLKIN